MDPVITVHGWCKQNVKEVYEAEGLYSSHYLEGDFTIEIIEGNKRIYITDFAGTHAPLWLPRNSTVVVENNKVTLCKPNFVTSNLYYNPPQGLTKRYGYDAFFLAIDEAVKLRCVDNPTITLSSGHDSGTIVASAISQELKFNTVSLCGEESFPTLMKRLALVEDNIVIKHWSEGRSGHEIVADYIPSKILLTGLGADELYISNDWQLLEEFLKSSSTIYHKKGIQVRYPLLDFKVYQEWFRLTDKLKGDKLHWKIPFKEYMDQTTFPVYTGRKISFGLSN